MPYIDPGRREDLDSLYRPISVGELTYALTAAVLRYLPTEPLFADYAEAIAAIECTKLELYARSVRPYEDSKIAKHGDLAYPRADRAKCGGPRGCVCGE